MRSYSDVVKKTECVAAACINSDTLKTVLKTVVAEKDRGRNLMVFGLEEEEDEQLADKISDVFQLLGEKPRVEASRVGVKRAGTAIRPVKVSLASANTVHQILIKSKTLRQAENIRLCLYVRIGLQSNAPNTDNCSTGAWSEEEVYWRAAETALHPRRDNPQWKQSDQVTLFKTLDYVMLQFWVWYMFETYIFDGFI